ncbi:MAG: DotU family type VI secretion system protein [Betaproteobacteria bacterium]|nr:DotU family type VI secretion system protein [Betaproteobacteria bacterium]MCC6247284.1 DotU family type VI secretion system protein [Rubrivivax sp.]MCL4697811.1 DotU family type VI secretion system protein [Burkholderiaceae bacterium]
MAGERPPIDDPFGPAGGGEGRTFVKPNPAGRAAQYAPGAASFGGESGHTVVGGGAGAAAGDAPVDHGLSPLLAAANRLMLLVPSLRQMRSADPAAVRASLAQGVRDFVAAAQAHGVAPERVMAARYILCTMLDEAAADTPWGGGGTWGRHSLLAEFHNEASGGEKVFQLMARLADKPAANRDLLELIYAAIALGFEGRYRVVQGGRAQLEAVRAKLAQLLAQARGPYPAPLAQHWAGQPLPERKGLSWLPLALTGLVAVLVLGGAYAAFSTTLAARSDPVYGQIQSLRLAPPVAAVAQPAAKPRLAVFLEPDIRAGIVAVRDEIDRSVVTVRGDGLFAPASATLVPEREALMRRIGEAMARVGGNVLVTGYTDNTPIRTLRFPSNWHLSDSRAAAVRDLLVTAGLPRERVRAEGRADGDPVAPNDSAVNRALNRRVEITLQTAVAAAVSAAPAAAAPR